MLNVNLQHECCRGYPLKLIFIESIICKGSNCSPVKLLGLKKEHVLGGKKALTFIYLEISGKQSCAKPSLHLQELWESWWGEGPLETSLDVYYFKTTMRRTGLAAWRCLAITFQMVFIRKMGDTIFVNFVQKSHQGMTLERHISIANTGQWSSHKRQCLLLLTIKPGLFSHLPSPGLPSPRFGQGQPWNKVQNISKAEADCEHHWSELDQGKPAIWTLLTVQRAQSSQGADAWD